MYLHHGGTMVAPWLASQRARWTNSKFEVELRFWPMQCKSHIRSASQRGTTNRWRCGTRAAICACARCALLLLLRVTNKLQAGREAQQPLELHIVEGVLNQAVLYL
jgi:hypothetical protein